MKVIAIEGNWYIQLFYLENKKQLVSLTDIDYQEWKNTPYEDFDKDFSKIEIELNEDLYDTALNFQKIQDSIIRNIFIETIKNLMNENNNVNVNISES